MVPFSTDQGLLGPVNFIIGLFNLVIPVFVAAALVFFMVGVVKYIYSEGDHTNRGMMLWSIVVLFVMISMWGTLRLLCSTFTGSASCGGTATSNYGGGSSGNVPRQL